jgi:hypothetical protein
VRERRQDDELERLDVSSELSHLSGNRKPSCRTARQPDAHPPLFAGLVVRFNATKTE